MSDSPEDVIAVGQYVIVKKQNYSRLYKVSPWGSLTLGRDQIEMHQIIGKPYWTTFEMTSLTQKKRYFALKVMESTESWSDLRSTLSSGSDNRCITDDSTSQKLSKEEILDLQESGKSGKEIVHDLIKNSRSFLTKTEYSQEKYIKRKEFKYCRLLTICKTSVVSLHEIYFKQDYTRIGGLRMDTLCQILSYSNVQSEGLYLLYESGSQGLLAAAMLNRIGLSTDGLLINFYPGNAAQTTLVQAMNFPPDQTDRHIVVNIYDFLKSYYKATFEDPNDAPMPDTSSQNTEKTMTNDNVVSQNHEEKEEKAMENDVIFYRDVCMDNDLNDQEIEKEKVEDDKMDSHNCEGTKDSEGVSCKDAEVETNTTTNAHGLKRKLSGDTFSKRPKWQHTRIIGKEHAKHLQRTVDLLKGSKACSLVIVAKEHPLNIATALLPFLGASRPFVIFHTYREPLQETYIALKQTQCVINLRLFSNFLRSYQVLPDRTHPDVLTRDTGGYILTGYLIEP